MKIAMITPVFHPSVGGMENFIENLALQLIRMGHEVQVGVFKVKGNGTPQVYEKSGIKIYTYSCLGHRLCPLIRHSTAQWRDSSSTCTTICSGR
jgi:hypothetical protein